MTRTEALATIEAESLGTHAWFGFPENVTDRVAIYQTPDGWVVVNTDERAVQGAIQTFTDEDSALDLFVRRLRLYK
ncbi:MULTISPECIES: hypothetical protein [unclassified Leifsonia]|uniref:hypothetical protein n=1 Tax=unclassified Leifsonia TaxID=2663824 RepID=UPI00092A96B4|nr:hypothetical protein [Leifsonia sp. 71-9]OJX78102.1 MAG: hypothetical protein BGO91_09535 [Leifsonia sp. 71-9]